MCSEKLDYSEIEKGLDFADISTFWTIKNLITYFEKGLQDGAPTINDAKYRELVEQKQASLYTGALELLKLWQDGVKECGKVQEPISKRYRQAPRLNDIVSLAIRLIRAYGDCNGRILQNNCNVLGTALNAQAQNLEVLSRELDILEAKAGSVEELKKHVRTLKKYVKTLEENNKFLQKENSDQHRTTRELIEDKHRHSGEKWATIPDCVRTVLELVEVEKNDGKNMPVLPKYDALRMAVYRWLTQQGKRSKKTKAGVFYPIADIADAMVQKYRGFEIVQYIRDFNAFGCTEDNLHRAPRVIVH